MTEDRTAASYGERAHVRDQRRDDQHADAAPEVPTPSGGNPGRPADGLYPRRVADSAGIRGTAEPEPWGEDPGLTAHLGAQGAAAFRAMFDAFPEAVGLLWAIRDDGGRIVDFDFGYGNPAIMRTFSLPRTQAGRFTMLEALPQMRDDGMFERYARVCDTGEAFVDEISFDTPFGDGYIRGTFSRRTAKLGDGLIVLMTDVTDQRRMEAELRGFADMVAHDLREPVTGIATS
jgi:PAS domain-containing protein